MAFIELISVIELLITHNPDSMRFNVEESITKQFIGKLTFLLYERDKTIDISDLKKELTLAYSIRSAIAHGNFSELEKHLDKLFSHYGYKRNAAGIDYRDNDNALCKLLSNASDWLRIVIECYLEDERKLNLIKAV